MRLVSLTCAAMVGLIATLFPLPSSGQTAALTTTARVVPSQASCDYSSLPGAVWWGTKRQMTMTEFASYMAPIYWFSPDEPTMNDLAGKALRVPEILPFEEQVDAPMVYYQFNDVGQRADGQEDGPAVVIDSTDMGSSIINLQNFLAANLKFIAYFSREEGLGGHAHDVEPTEFRVWVFPNSEEVIRDFNVECDRNMYVMGILRTTGEAHGLEWYFNVLDTDDYTQFPMHLLVEEGKHGMCTDKNGDGYYTPGFDVNVRVNDAWGVRDIIRQGALFTGGFEAWMAKVRRKEHRAFPPLPEDSPLRERHSENGVYAPDNAIYQLRPFPAASEAGDDELLHHKMEEKEKPGWPEIHDVTEGRQLSRWADAGLALKSFAISLRADGDLGFSFVFPLFILKNFEDPMTGGFLVHRMYLKDKRLRDFGWQLMYTPSASRWVDTYFGAGVEWDREDVPASDTTAATTVSETHFVLETGVKFRVNITKSPLRFLSFLTEFMGFRAGIKNTGFFDIDRLTYVLEFGAGVW
jgi:hypothetical protein